MRRLALCMTVLALAFFAGCGVKGPPTLAPPSDQVKIISMVGAYKPGTGVTLLWDIEGSSGELTGFKVSRGEELIGASKCRSCDGFYVPVASLSAQEAAATPGVISGEPHRQYGFIDPNIKEDYAYFYRVRPTYKNGASGARVGLSVETRP